jgi:hypothetical protein
MAFSMASVSRLYNRYLTQLEEELSHVLEMAVEGD